VYSGSLERIDFGEEDEAKGFCWVELGRGSTTWTFHPVSARPFRTVRVDVREREDPTAAVIEAIDPRLAEGAVVRLLVTLRADQQALLHEREIEAALGGASSYALARMVENEDRARLGEAALETLSPLQLVEQYFRSRGEAEPRLEALLARAGALLAEEGLLARPAASGAKR
jgi:exonuclease SbcD